MQTTASDPAVARPLSIAPPGRVRLVLGAVLAAGIGALIVPALAMGHGMMGGGMMSGGCAGMMQSMNGGDGRPNSQWQSHVPAAGSVPD